MILAREKTPTLVTHVLQLFGLHATRHSTVSCYYVRQTKVTSRQDLFLQWRRQASTNSGECEEGSFLTSVLSCNKNRKGKGKRTSVGQKAEDHVVAGDATGSLSTSSGDALVPSSPESKLKKLYVVELLRKPLFPGIYTPVLVVKNEKLIREVQETKRQGGQAYLGAFLRRSEVEKEGTNETSGELEAVEVKEAEDAAAHIHEVGTFAQVHTVLPGDTASSAQLLLLGHRRIRRTAVVSTEPLRVTFENLKDEHYDKDDDLIKATSMEIVNTMKDLLQMNPLYGEQFRTLMTLTGSIDLNDLSRLVDAAASLTSADDATLQMVLEQLDVPARARSVLELLKKEVELCRLQADIREQVESKIMREQRRMLLMEQLRSIKKELGMEKDDKSALLQRFQTKWETKKAQAPKEVQQVVQDELDKLSGLEPVSPEFTVTRTYLEWLTCLPWATWSEEIFDIEHAERVLNEDHFGLEDVKDRILEFIAVSRLRGSAQGKILCLVGPPGVGKTSVGRSIARTLNRKYFRFSVGGLYDVAEIKGHRRTYVGAMPGKMVQCLKSTQTSNPLVLIDEIDKLGRGHTGDPASALLELLDPEQNQSFLDHYLDVPIDLSKVLFVCTANVLDTIPGPLQDRMEVIRLSGYASDEKRAIARRYLEVQAMADAGVPSDCAQITESAMDRLIHEYCREAGVRNLKKHLEKIYRKVALQLVTASPCSPVHAAQSSPKGSMSLEEGAGDAGLGQPMIDAALPPSPHVDDQSVGAQAACESAANLRVVIDSSNLKDYVGQPPFANDRFYDTTPPGVVMGLAWTAMGGATLYVEAAKVVDGESRGGLTTTGQLGDVFKESVSLAYTFARSYLHSIRPEDAFFSTSSVHVHVPSGATPKDGPSAGCTIITALLSLALGKAVRPNLAMTGEVTLTGRILPIGGVKEKLLAARRSGVTCVIFPKANQQDYDELSPGLKEGIEPHFVEHFDDIYRLALQDDVLKSKVPSEPVVVVASHQNETVHCCGKLVAVDNGK